MFLIKNSSNSAISQSKTASTMPLQVIKTNVLKSLFCLRLEYITFEKYSEILTNDLRIVKSCTYGLLLKSDNKIYQLFPNIPFKKIYLTASVINCWVPSTGHYIIVKYFSHAIFSPPFDKKTLTFFTSPYFILLHSWG